MEELLMKSQSQTVVLVKKPEQKVFLCPERMEDLRSVQLVLLETEVGLGGN